MSSPTIISQMALGLIGSSKPISSFESDSSKEAQACRLFYPVVIDEMLRDFVWPFAVKFAVLSLVSSNPTIEYQYAYRYPQDCLDFHRILSGLRNDTRQSRIHYRFGADDQGKLIYTDRQNAECEYASKAGRQPNRWDADFQMAAAYRLASYIAPMVTGGDPFKVGQLAAQMYRLSCSKAQANAANEQQDEDIPESEFINSRN